LIVRIEEDQPLAKCDLNVIVLRCRHSAVRRALHHEQQTAFDLVWIRTTNKFTVPSLDVSSITIALELDVARANAVPIDSRMI
jgi:hypothetical protein